MLYNSINMNYILYGEQYPMIRKKLNKILEERLGIIDEFNVSKFDMDETELSEALFDASMLPLGCDRKAVVLDHVEFLSRGANKDDVTQILELVQSDNDAIDIFFIVRHATIDDKSPIVAEIKDKGQIINFVNLTKDDWPIYVRKYFKDRSGRAHV